LLWKKEALWFELAVCYLVPGITISSNMKPLFVLIVSFCIGLSRQYMLDEVDLKSAGRIALCTMLFFTAVGHFKFPKGMAMMLPPFVPAKGFLIFITGLLEIAAAVCLFIPSASYYAGWFLILMFIVFLPANIYASSRHINYETASYDGKGLSYLWFRLPFQLLLIGWVWWFVIRQ